MLIVGIEAFFLFFLVLFMWFVLFKRRVHPSDGGLAAPINEDAGKTTLHRDHDEPPASSR